LVTDSKIISEVKMKTEVPGICGECRHANHHTADAAQGLWACPWLGTTSAESSCEVKYKATGEYAFEFFDGNNATWNRDALFRAVPAGYEEREVEVNRPALDFDTWFD
jgi:hypothetical protein